MVRVQEVDEMIQIDSRSPVPRVLSRKKTGYGHRSFGGKTKGLSQASFRFLAVSSGCD